MMWFRTIVSILAIALGPPVAYASVDCTSPLVGCAEDLVEYNFANGDSMRIDLNRMKRENRLYLGKEVITVEGYGVLGGWAKWYVVPTDCNSGGGEMIARFSNMDPGTTRPWRRGGTTGPDKVATDMCAAAKRRGLL